MSPDERSRVLDVFRGVVDEFLAGHPEIGIEGERELVPFSDGVDGAFVARLRKRRD